jgi:DNA-directed RNA polymerase specialized sigma24 family protein
MAKDVKKFYVTIDGQEVKVNEQVYREYKRPLWREHKRKERASRCSLGSKRCTGDCKNCQYLREGAQLSLNTMFDDGLDVAAEGCLEDVIELKMKIEALHEALNNLDPADRDIIYGFAYGESDRKIAERLVRPQTTVSYRRKVILKQLRKDLKDWK